MRRWVPGALALLVAGCTLPAGAPSSTADVTTSGLASVSATPSPVSDDQLPLAAPISGDLLSGTNPSSVTARLHEAAAGLPVLKLDVTADSITMHVLVDGKRVDALRWYEDQITRVDSDVQFLQQATFQPLSFPLDQARRMFDIADLRGVRGDEQVLQIVEYRPGQVLITVTSRPATTTVFFRSDGTAVADLGITGVADISAGLAEVIGEDTEAYAVGFDSTRGYWADLVDEEDGVVRNRTRLRGLPVFETRRNETPRLARFDPSMISAPALAKAIARSQKDPAEECAVTIDLSLERSAPVARIDCQGRISYADLTGRDMTELIE